MAAVLAIGLEALQVRALWYLGSGWHRTAGWRRGVGGVIADAALATV
jgi:hypothetical protein